jgi:methylglutaconyl-CoA hydratase
MLPFRKLPILFSGCKTMTAPFSYETLQVNVTDDVATVQLNRPEVRNAFNETMIAELTDAFTHLPDQSGLRAIVLAGAGTVFCAGADIDWMRRSIDRTEADNVADARAMAAMYTCIDSCPVPVIGRVQRAAFGGAVGLMAVCDMVVADRDAKICFSETRLGIIPAVISTFSIAKIGIAQARRFFLTAEVFTAAEAPAGLVHKAVDAASLDSHVEQLVAALREVGPQAAREIKALIPEVAMLDREQAIEVCVDTIARVRVSKEAQAGLRAFLHKSDPPWRESKGSA